MEGALVEFGISLGSNLGNKRQAIEAALRLLRDDPDISITAVSPLYRTAPWGRTDQDWFVNACALGETGLEPLELLSRCQAVESELGRARQVKWGPRHIDVDILFYGERALVSERLTLPHPEMFNRAFVLVPLSDIAGERVIAGRRVKDALRGLRRTPADVAPL